MVLPSKRRLLRGIEPLEERALLASIPTGEFAFAGSVRYFAADDGLWRAGDSGETMRLAALANVQKLTEWGGALFFRADDGVHGAELWRSDGTPLGTQLVKDIRPGSLGSDLDNLTAFGSALYFSANDGTHGSELWKSDGYDAGTQFIVDHHEPDYQVIFATSWAFLTGTQVDGSFLGIRNIADADMWVNGFAVKNDALYQKATSVTGNLSPFKALLSTSTQSAREHIPILGPIYNTRGELVATGDADLWDGSLQHRIYDEKGNDPPGFGVWTGTFPDGSFSGASRADWTAHWSGAAAATVGDWRKTDSTWITAGVTTSGVANLLYSVSPLLPGDDVSSNPSNFLVHHDELYFTATDPLHGRELWKTDGTIAGTKRVTDIRSGAPDSQISNLVFAGDTLYFTADDGVHGRQLWSYEPLTDAVVSFDLPAESSGFWPTQLVAAPNWLYFVTTNSANDREIWSMNFESGSINRLAEIDSLNSQELNLTVLDNRLFFTHTNEFGNELWTSEGTLESTHLVKDILSPEMEVQFPNAHGSNPAKLKVVGDRLYFTANDGWHGTELWSSDGTELGTYLVWDMNIEVDEQNSAALGATVNQSSAPEELTEVDGNLYFVSDDGLPDPFRGRLLWRFEPSQYAMVGTSRSGPVSKPPYHLQNVGGRLWYFADNVFPHVWVGDANGEVMSAVFDTIGTISGKQWIDTNGNSFRDDGEAGVADVDVWLLTTSLHIWSVSRTQADGTYTFGPVIAGNYYVMFDPPDGTEFVAPHRRQSEGAAFDAVDSDADPFTGVTDLVNKPIVFSVTSVDAGVREPLEFPWQNPAGPWDVNDDGDIGLFDVVLIVEQLRDQALGDLSAPTAENQPPAFLDVNGNNELDFGDVILLVEYLRHSPTEEIELASTPPADPESASNEIAGQIATGLALSNVEAPEPEAATIAEESYWVPGGSTSIYSPITTFTIEFLVLPSFTIVQADDSAATSPTNELEVAVTDAVIASVYAAN